MYTTTVFNVRIGRHLVVWMMVTILAGSVIPAISLAQQSPAIQNLTITVLYDDNPYQKGLNASFGFSCLIEGLEKTILFDTGGSGVNLLANMTKLGIQPEEIDLVVLSHSHDDHARGLFDFLEKYHDVTAYLPVSFQSSYKNDVKKYGAEVVEVQEPVKICEQVYSSGEIGYPIKEQALFIQTDKGLIVITGCAHPGIVKIVQNAKDLLQDEVLFVMGGFHLGSKRRAAIEQMASEFKQLGVRYVGPCHCSGDVAKQVFKEAYQANFVSVGVGKVITLKELP